ncbi:MAG: cobalamin-dependent protein [Balneolaceae bacterium]
MSQKDLLLTDIIDEQKMVLGRKITDRYFQAYPTLEVKYGKIGREKCLEDTLYHLDQLISSVEVNSQILFNNYLEWVDILLRERHIPTRDLQNHLVVMRAVLNDTLQPEQSQFVDPYLEEGIRFLQNLIPESVTYLHTENPLYQESKLYLNALLQGDRKEASRLIDGLVSKKIPIKQIYEYIFQISQYEIGALWQTNRISVAQEHFSTAATQQNMARLYPHIFSTERKGMKLVACSVAGELHEIGIRMVSDFFEMEGWDTYYMGANMPASQLIEMLEEYKADVLAISVSLSVHIRVAESLIRNVRQQKQLDRIKIMTGGIPFNLEPNLWKEIGADATAPTAQMAIETAAQWAQ